MSRAGWQKFKQGASRFFKGAWNVIKKAGKGIWNGIKWVGTNVVVPIFRGVVGNRTNASTTASVGQPLGAM